MVYYLCYISYWISSQFCNFNTLNKTCDCLCERWNKRGEVNTDLSVFLSLSLSVLRAEVAFCVLQLPRNQWDSFVEKTRFITSVRFEACHLAWASGPIYVFISLQSAEIPADYLRNKSAVIWSQPSVFAQIRAWIFSKPLQNVIPYNVAWVHWTANLA